MTPQKPAEGIALTRDFKDAKFFTVQCSCGNVDDAIDFWVELEEYGEISVHTTTTQKTSWWDDPFNQAKSHTYDKEWQYYVNRWVRGILNGLSHRLKVTWSVWTRGYVEYSQTTSMSKQQALNYATALSQAVQDLEEFKQKKELNVEN